MDKIMSEHSKTPSTSSFSKLNKKVLLKKVSEQKDVEH